MAECHTNIGQPTKPLVEYEMGHMSRSESNTSSAGRSIANGNGKQTGGQHNTPIRRDFNSRRKCTTCRRVYKKKHTCFGKGHRLKPECTYLAVSSTVSHSPSLPQPLLVHEALLYSIKAYFENSCRSMKFDEYGDLLVSGDANLISDFDSFCFTATVFNKKGLHLEFRRALSRATALVVQILQVEHPRTLACFFEVFIHFIQNGLPDVTSYFRDIIKHLSANRKGLWAQICRLLCAPDSEYLDQALAQAWRCITDTFDTELGTSSRLAVSVRLDYIKRVYEAAKFREEELLLRNILTQFGTPKPPTPRVMLNLAHNLNRQGKYYEAEEMALEVYLLLGEYEIYARRVVEKIESLKIISHSQFNLRNEAAEQTMLNAIRMIVVELGKDHSWVPEFKNVLEGWLRGWGRVADADILRGEIDELVGKDEIDKRDQSS